MNKIPRILLSYYSKSGTTEKMAKEIAKGIEKTDVDLVIKKISEVDIDSLPEFDGLILGSPTYYGLPSAEIKEFLDKSIKYHEKLDGMVGGAFTSSENIAGGNETTIMAILEALLIHGMIIKGISKGNYDHYGPVVIGKPDKKELEQCRNYGREVASLVRKICD